MPHAKSAVPLIAATVALVAGTAVGYAFGTRSASDAAYDRGYEQARTDIRERMADAPQGNVAPGPAGASPTATTAGAARPTLSVSGSITELRGGAIILASTTKNPDPTADPFPTTRRVTVAENAVLEQRIAKAPEVLDAERRAFQQSLANREAGSRPPQPPTPFTETTIKVSDLIAGMQVIVSAEEDIGTAEEFTAARILVVAVPE
jgi:hypothetical protein